MAEWQASVLEVKIASVNVTRVTKANAEVKVTQVDLSHGVDPGLHVRVLWIKKVCRLWKCEKCSHGTQRAILQPPKPAAASAKDGKSRGKGEKRRKVTAQSHHV